MLYEIHGPLGDELAAILPMKGVKRLLDVGGGSGVMSHALLNCYPGLSTVVADHPHVCAAGKEIAGELSLLDRIDFRACDFLNEDLPGGFDMVLFCDMGIYEEVLFRKLRTTLNAGGRLVILDKFGAGDGLAHPSRTHWALLGSLSDSPLPQHYTDDVLALLRQVGFRSSSAMELPDLGFRWSSGWTLITACN